MALRHGSNAGKVTKTQPGRVKIARWDYDFAVDGGTQGAITLSGDEVPLDTVIIDARVVVETAVTSGGSATAALHMEGAADLRAAATLATAPALSTTGVKALLNAVKTTASRDVTLTVGTADLTAGKFHVLVTYVEAANA